MHNPQTASAAAAAPVGDVGSVILNRFFAGKWVKTYFI